MRHYLAMNNLAEAWEPLGARARAKVIGTFDGVDLRLRDPRGGAVSLAPGVRETIDAWSAAGREVRGHDWEGESRDRVSIADAASGQRDGLDAARRALGAGVSSFAANGEWALWRADPWIDGDPDPNANPHADEAMIAFERAFHGLAPWLALDSLMFSDPRLHYDPRADVDDDGHPDAEIHAAVRVCFRRHHVMAYQSTYTGIRATLERARRAWPTHPLTAWAGVGRVDQDLGVVGNAAAWTRIAREAVAGIDEITWYVGNGAAGQILRGHRTHPPLVSLIPQIRGAAA